MGCQINETKRNETVYGERAQAGGTRETKFKRNGSGRNETKRYSRQSFHTETERNSIFLLQREWKTKRNGIS